MNSELNDSANETTEGNWPISIYVDAVPKLQPLSNRGHLPPLLGYIANAKVPD